MSSLEAANSVDISMRGAAVPVPDWSRLIRRVQGASRYLCLACY